MSISKKLKSSDNSTAKEKLSKKVPDNLYEYLDLKANKMAPCSNQVMEQYGIKFYLWTKENKSALRMHEFCAEQGISRRTFLRWKDISPIFAQYYEEGLLNLADRREAGAIRREYDSGIVVKAMPFYDPEWREAEEWRAGLGEGNQNGNGRVVVVMQPFDEDKK